jgi:hypothetical protein
MADDLVFKENTNMGKKIIPIRARCFSYQVGNSYLLGDMNLFI